MQELQRRMKKKYESVCSCRGRKGNSSKLDVMKQVERQTLLEVQQGLCAPLAVPNSQTRTVSSGPGPRLATAFTRVRSLPEMVSP